MKKIVVLGGGGHAKVVISALLSAKCYAVEGVLDPGLEKGSSVLGCVVLGADEDLGSLGKDVLLANGLGSIRSSLEDSKRKNLFKKYNEAQYEFPRIVHESAVVSEDVKLAEGVQVMAGCVVQPSVQVGENSILNSKSLIEHDSVIGSHCHIAPGAVLGGNVSIGDDSFVGLGARILPGVKIGCGVTIGAGAVVVKDVKDGVTVIGVPAKLKGVEACESSVS